MTITPEYRALNAELHRKMEKYGANGRQWESVIREWAAKVNAQSILDYGCGKGSLARALADLDVREYDPAIPGKDSLPEPADLVVCTDVLEHVEIECIEDVLKHLDSLARRALFLNISLRQGTKRLPDGRRAHQIVKPKEWWRQRIAFMGKWRQIDSEALSYNVVCIRDAK